jgi:two-component system nitrogen regulation sensor histidine kinase GlnL
MPIPTDDKPVAFSLADLSRAIGELRGACGKLEVSMGGVNDELDETNQRLAEALQSQRATLAYLESILSAIPSGVVVVDTNGRIVLFNQSAEALTGFTADEVKGLSYSKTLGDGVPQKLTPLYTLATGAWTINEEKILTTKFEGQVPVSFSTSLVVDAANRITGAIEVLTDLSRMKLLEEEVARVRTLATIGEVAAEVAHEVRNPLGGIKGYASLLSRDLKDSPAGLALVDKILEGIESLERIVGDLLESGKPATLELEHVDLAGELRRIVEMFDMAARGEGKNIIFEVVLSEEPFYCRVDRGRLNQAVTNLLRNAADAVGDSGRVTVRACTAKAEGNRGGSPLKPIREYLSIEVADTGPGVADEVIGKIFSPFFTTKSDGTGLGLATVRRVAALHGGEVRYKKGDGGGGRFIVEIPRR